MGSVMNEEQERTKKIDEEKEERTKRIINTGKNKKQIRRINVPR